MARNTADKILLRSHMAWSQYDLINKRSCLHIDAWLYENSGGEYYFIIRACAGGRVSAAIGGDAAGLAYYRASEADGLLSVQRPDDLDAMTQRHIDSPYTRRNAPWLAAVHWRYIYPALRGTSREGFKGHVSVYLHYVYTSPAVDEPTAGLENLYAVTGLAGRDAARVSAPVYRPDTTVTPGTAWGARDRSKLRTLNKLLTPSA